MYSNETLTMLAIQSTEIKHYVNWSGVNFQRFSVQLFNLLQFSCSFQMSSQGYNIVEYLNIIITAEILIFFWFSDN